MTEPETPEWKNDPDKVWPFGRPAEAAAPPEGGARDGEAAADQAADAPTQPYISRQDAP
jgi:hypothetical protein